MASCLVAYSSSSNDSTGSESDDNSSHYDKRQKIEPSEPPHECQLTELIPSTDETKSKTGTSRLPMPKSIRTMFEDKSSTDNQFEDLDKHEGRIRSFAHERGNWASYIYFPCGSDEDLVNIAASLVDTLKTLVDIEFKAMDHFHLSLSRTFVARHHWIQPLTSSLRNNLQFCKMCLLSLQRIKVYCNDEETRTFLGVEVKDIENGLPMIVQQIDSALAEFALPKYYEEPSFHISMAWTIGDQTEKVNKNISKLQEQLNALLEDHADASDWVPRQCQLKMGNKLFNLPLSDS